MKTALLTEDVNYYLFNLVDTDLTYVGALVNMVMKCQTHSESGKMDREDHAHTQGSLSGDTYNSESSRLMALPLTML